MMHKEPSEEAPPMRRSPSTESLGRLHQQSGGFAGQTHFPKENSGFSHYQGGFRRGNYNGRGRQQPRGGYHDFSGYNRNRSYQNHHNHYKNQQYQQNAANLNTNLNSNLNSNSAAQQRPIFNSTHSDYGAFSFRRPESPATAKTMLFRSNELQMEHERAPIHNYRAAGTAPGGLNTTPFKQPPPQPPSTPADIAEDWQRFPPPPPGIPVFRRSPEPVELQLKAAKQFGNEMMPISLPTTPSAIGNVQFGVPMKDAPMGRSMDSVDAQHPCFSNERLHSAIYGVSPQVKGQHQPPGIPILNDREASLTMEEMQKLHLLHQQQAHFQQQMQQRGAAPIYPQYAFPAMFSACAERAFKSQLMANSVRIGEELDVEKMLQIEHNHHHQNQQKTKRDSSIQSRGSSRADPEATVEILDKLDLELTAPSNGELQNELPPRKPKARRDSECSTISSSALSEAPPGIGGSGGLDESTLTKILPTDEFHRGRGVASPSPPAALLSEPLSRMDVLSEKIWDYHNKVAQTDEMLRRKLHLRDMLYTAISPVFPMSGLYVVGSSLNGFGNNSSDMDLCLMITNKDLDQKNDAVVVLNLILSTLQYEKFVASQKLILAKVPILRIKFAAPFDDITVDLNANNSVAIRNTHLLCYYSSYDWRVRPLVSVVKEWAKRKGINDANKSSFTSYSLVLMVIHYLQCGNARRVLPNLQHTYPDRFSNKVDVRTLNVTMPLEHRPDASLDEQQPSEKTTLGELLIGFLDYYANRFDYDHDAISIRQGQRVERAALAARPKVQEKETPPPSSSASSTSLHNGAQNHQNHFWRSQWRCVCIEEPFTNSNTAHSIYDEMVFGAIKEAFREAHAELQHNHDLDRLMECEPIKASTNNAGAAVFAATYEGERPVSQQPTSIASAGLRAMTVMGSASNGAHFNNFQAQTPTQQQQPQVLKQQQQRSNQQFQMNRGAHQNGVGGASNNNRRQYQQVAPRNARSNESFQKVGGAPGAQQVGGAKENQNVHQKQRKEEPMKTKRGSPSK